MRSNMECSKESLTGHSEGCSLRKQPLSRNGKRYYFVDLIRDIAALATGTGSALIIQRYHPLHDNLSRSLSRKSNINISAESRQLWPELVYFKWMWMETASTLNRAQEVKNVGICNRLTVLPHTSKLTDLY
jgi:hypothetical protein